MSNEEIELFKTQFRKIVYAKTKIKDSEMYLKKLHAYDKHGSHSKAILKGIDELNSRKNDLKRLLRGIDYDTWLNTSKKISALKTQLKSARRKNSKLIFENKLCKYQPSFNYKEETNNG